MLLLIDNYDSFTYNLVHYLGELGAEVTVRRNDALDVQQAMAMRPDAIVLSPGPCDPAQAGHLPCPDRRSRRNPHAAAGRLPRAPGHRSGLRRQCRALPRDRARQDGRHASCGTGCLRGSALALPGDALPLADRRPRHPARAAWRSRPGSMTARSWACATAILPIEGVQFHPESIASEHGHRMLATFLDTARVRRTVPA